MHCLDTPVVTAPPLNRSVYEKTGTEQLDCGADGNAHDGKDIKYHWYKTYPTPAYEIKNSDGKDPEITIEDDGKRLKFVKPSRNLATIYFCAGQNQLGHGKPKGAYLNVTCK